MIPTNAKPCTLAVMPVSNIHLIKHAMTKNLSQIIPLNIVQLYYDVKDMNGDGGWGVDSGLKKMYYREPVSAKFQGLDNMSFETITYEVIRQFKNKNYIHTSISMKFNIVSFDGETKEQENYRCMFICAAAMQDHIKAITKGHDYLAVDVSVNSDTKFEPPPADKLGLPRLN